MVHSSMYSRVALWEMLPLSETRKTWSIDLLKTAIKWFEIVIHRGFITTDKIIPIVIYRQSKVNINGKFHQKILAPKVKCQHTQVIKQLFAYLIQFRRKDWSSITINVPLITGYWITKSRILSNRYILFLKNHKTIKSSSLFESLAGIVEVQPSKDYDISKSNDFNSRCRRFNENPSPLWFLIQCCFRDPDWR